MNVDTKLFIIKKIEGFFLRIYYILKCTFYFLNKANTTVHANLIYPLILSINQFYKYIFNIHKTYCSELIKRYGVQTCVIG